MIITVREASSASLQLSAAPAARLFIVEEHALVRQMLAFMARQELELVVAGECASLTDGLEACLREQPDLVIFDWVPAVGRGFELVRKARLRLPQTRWICLSSHEHDHLVREAIDLGVHGFVLKRADLGILTTAIRTVLAGQSYYCPLSSTLLIEAMRNKSAGTAATLTARERIVLCGIASGKSPKNLAPDLGVAVKTVHNHLASLKAKLEIYEPAGLVRYAIRHGMVESP